MSNQKEIQQVVTKVIHEVYGRNAMSTVLIENLTEKIVEVAPSRRLNGIILRMCWDTMPGGGTAVRAADKIEAELNRKALV